MMVAAVSGAASTTASDPDYPKTTNIVSSQDDLVKRTPLLPSERDNSNGVSSSTKRPKSRVVPSRYMSPSTSTSTSNSSSVSSSSSTSRRYPSPLVSRNSTSVSDAPSLAPKRAVSVDRRRPSPARALASDLDPKNGSSVNDVSNATKLLVTSTRSLSVSFQGEAFSLPISKTKVTPPSPNLSSVRKGTPERRRTGTPIRGKSEANGDQFENSRLSDQHRWPARTRMVNINNPLSKSLNCGDSIASERNRVIGSASSIRALQQSMVEERRPPIDGRFSLDLGHSEILKAVRQNSDNCSESCLQSTDFTASDSDSVSSGSTSGVQECGATLYGKKIGPRGIAVSAKFWQETNSRLRRLQDPGSPLSSSPSSKLIAPAKLKRLTSDGPLSSPRSMSSSPARGGIRAASPSKLMTPLASSPSRGHSPSRIRNAVSTINNSFNETPSVLSFSVDVRRGKVVENKIIDAHLLRLLYNRHLQWRFVNARTEAVLVVQKHVAEKNLWNAWITISDLRDTVTKRRHRLQLLRQKLKLASVLKGQMKCLEDWASLDEDLSSSLFGAIEALKASTLRLPVVGGATADILSLKDAVSSTVDVMQAMASSICLLLPMVEELNSLVTELAKVTTKERALLERCRDCISLLASVQVKDSSLRTHIIQHSVRNCV